MKSTEKEVKMPYWNIDLPDIEKVYGGLQNVKNAINMAFSGYCGANYELKHVVLQVDKYTEQTNAKLEEVYGISPHTPTLDTLTISKMASSQKCFDENYHSYTSFSEIMENIEATMPKPKRKTALTDSDKKLIDTLISSNYPSLAQSEAVKIAKADSRLGELLSLDERYRKAVKEALGGGIGQ